MGTDGKDVFCPADVREAVPSGETLLELAHDLFALTISRSIMDREIWFGSAADVDLDLRGRGRMFGRDDGGLDVVVGRWSGGRGRSEIDVHYRSRRRRSEMWLGLGRERVGRGGVSCGTLMECVRWVAVECVLGGGRRGRGGQDGVLSPFVVKNALERELDCDVAGRCNCGRRRERGETLRVDASLAIWLPS